MDCIFVFDIVCINVGFGYSNFMGFFIVFYVGMFVFVWIVVVDFILFVFLEFVVNNVVMGELIFLCNFLFICFMLYKEYM